MIGVKKMNFEFWLRSEEVEVFEGMVSNNQGIRMVTYTAGYHKPKHND